MVIPRRKTITTLSLMVWSLTCSQVLAGAESDSLRNVTAVNGVEPKPNIVFILIDDLGWSDLGCYGNTFNETPNIDRLASQGMRFTDAYAAGCVCSPTRASILTGKYPATLHLTDFIAGHPRPWAKLTVPDFNKALPLKEVTIAEVLKRAGYVSGHFGKWHLGDETHYPDKQGFDEFVVTRGRHFAPKFRTTPEIDVPDGAYLADVLTDQAEQFIDRNRDRPFFLHLSHYAVHIPLQAKQELIAKYKAKPRPSEGVNHPVYAAMLESVDQSVGRILEKLDALELSERTLVIVTSDNGGLIRMFRGTGPVVTTNDPLRSEKGTLYEGGIRVPLIARWPGRVASGSESRTPVSSADFLPTFADVAGLGPEHSPRVDGKSLLPVLRNDGTLDRDAIYWHYPHYHHATPASAIRQGDHKLLEFYEDGRLELYDLSKDIQERYNLAEQMPDKAAALRDKLQGWLKSVDAQMPRPNPDYDPAREGEWGHHLKRPPVRVPEARRFGPSRETDARAPDGTVISSETYRATIPADLLDERGTMAVWLRPDQRLLGEADKLYLMDGDAFEVMVDPRKGNVVLILHGAAAMTGQKEGEKANFYWMSAGLTHLKAEHWYHLAWTWDTKDGTETSFYLDGVRQNKGRTLAFEGLLKPAGRDVEVQVGVKGLTIGELSVWDRRLNESQLEAVWREGDTDRYTWEGARFTAERFVPADVDWRHPVYETAFDDPSALNDWRLEGGARMSVADGNLVLESDPQDAGNHLVCWLKKEAPADFLLEFTVRPEDRQNGLNIVFFNARGVNGESIFAPTVAERDGTFSQYHSGDLDNYHISYWAGGRGTANCRKNKGFQLVAIGEDLIDTTPANAFQTVRLYKNGGKIRLTVDDIVAVAFDDDGELFGPVHDHSGWIGLRQMGHTRKCEYGYVRVYPLTAE